MKSSSIDGGKGETERSPLDLYPTPPASTFALMYFLREIGAMPSKVWEPAMGLGHMLKVINHFTRVVGTDIVTGDDFFHTDKPEGVDGIITNPPFVLAEEFIRRANTMVPTMAFITKATYWHAKVRAPLFQEIPPTFVAALMFRMDPQGRGKPTMSHLWNIWLPDRSPTRFVLFPKPLLPPGY